MHRSPLLLLLLLLGCTDQVRDAAGPGNDDPGHRGGDASSAPGADEPAVPPLRALPASGEVDEDGVLLLALHSEGTPTPVTFVIEQAPLFGSVTITNAARGEAVYRPAPDWFGTDLFLFAAVEGERRASGAATVVVRPINDPPYVEAIVATVLEDDALVLLIESHDVDDDELTFSLVEAPGHGEVVFDGELAIYNPDRDYVGPDAFSFAASDGRAASNVARAAIEVLPQPDGPTAVDMDVETPEDTPLALQLAGEDVDGDALTYLILSEPAAGALLGGDASAGTLTYVPSQDYFGPDSFWYAASAGALFSAPKIVRILVQPVNDPPLAAGGRLQMVSGEAAQIAVSGSDVEGDPLTFAVATWPEHGALIFNGRVFTYLPLTGYAGPDRFSYVAHDGKTSGPPGWVDVWVTRGRSCSDGYARGLVLASGVHLIDPDGPEGADPFEAHCDVAADGGAWTLVLKLAAGSFCHDSVEWTRPAPLNPEAMLDATYPASNAYDAKSPAFYALGDVDQLRFTSTFGEVALDFLGRGSPMNLVTTRGVPLAASPRYDGWRRTFGQDRTGAPIFMRAGVAEVGVNVCRSNPNATPVGCGKPCMLCYQAADSGCCGCDASGSDVSSGVGLSAEYCGGGLENCSAAGSWSRSSGVVHVWARRRDFTDVPPAASCAEHLADGHVSSGVYSVDLDGPGPAAPVEAVCDMAGDEGGWTLLMKSTGDSTFNYGSFHWTAPTTLNAWDMSTAAGNVKYESFNRLPLREVRATFPRINHTMIAPVANNMTALANFDTPRSLGMPGSPLPASWPKQCGYQQYGYKLATCPSQAWVRWGWVFNNEADCNSPDAGAGIGLNGSPGSGAWSTCCTCNGIAPAVMQEEFWLWGR